MLDLALLKADLRNTKYISFSKDEPKKLQRIIVAGYPFGQYISDDLKFTSGIVSSLKGPGDDSTLVQVDAALNVGNSGGPIFNKFGEIVGIATGKINKEEVLKNEGFIPEDVNYAVKTDRVASFLNLPIKVSLKNTTETNYEYNAQELYKYMRSAVVLIVGQE